MEKNPTLKYLKSWNLHPKPDLAITFWVVLLIISFEDLILIFYIWVPNTTIKDFMRKSNLNNTLLLYLGIWPKNYGFNIPEHYIYIYIYIHLTVLAPLGEGESSILLIAIFVFLGLISNYCLVIANTSNPLSIYTSYCDTATIKLSHS